MRLLPVLLAFSVFACAATPSLAGSKKHHSASANSAASKKAVAESHAKAMHLARLAAKEKKEWRDHLAKMRELPRAERLAVKRHDRVWKREHDAKVEAMQAAHAAKVAAMMAAARKAKRAQMRQARLAQSKPHGRHAVQHLAKAAPPKASPRTHARPLTIARSMVNSPLSAHAKHVAALLAMQQAAQQVARIRQAARAQKLAALSAAHQANVSQQQAAIHARLARQQALYALHQANIQAAYRAHLANVEAAHNARVAAERSHWVALHGDGSGGKSIRFWQTAAAGVPVKIISVDLNDSNVKVSAVMARRGNGTSEPFRQMIDRANPNVAVTGTFFSLDDLQPIGDIVIDGSLVHFGGMGTALCITPDNHADMVTCDWGRHHDWSLYDFVVTCGPRLLRNGRVVLDPHSERFRDRHMLSPNSRIAVGITSGNTLFFVMTHEPIYLGRLARVMQSLGASEAMNLDAGTSTGFYYNGATLARPGRQLTNMIVVYGHRDRYERALDQLVPAAYRRTATRYRRQVSEATSKPASLVRQ